jgi:hypothetical protein
VLIAFVQGVICAFDKDLCPLNQSGGQKRNEGAKEDFLEKGRVHANFESNVGASMGILCENRPLLGTRVADFSINGQSDRIEDR